MWLYTTHGLISVVQHRDHKDTMLVRARRESQLRAVLSHYLPGEDADVALTPEADYMARTVLSRDVLGRLMANVAAGITYPNFKNAARGDAYHGHLIRVWQDAVSRLQNRRSD